jgi:hypothetical protein
MTDADQPGSGNAPGGGRFDIPQVIAYATSILTEPAAFYRSMSKTGGLVEPVIYVAVMGLVTGVLLAFLSLFGLGGIGAMGAGLASIIMFPIFAVIGSFIGAAILFVIWKLMGSGEPFETSYRCLAFATTIYPISAVASLIPYFGSIISVVWMTWLIIVASIEVHRLNAQTVYVVFGILGALLLISNIAGERSARMFEAQMERMGAGMGSVEEMTPEQAGRALGEFMKGLESTQGTAQQASGSIQ